MKNLTIRGHKIAGRMCIFQRWARDAIRERRKTQTRRLMNPQPIKDGIACISPELIRDPNLYLTWLKNSDGGYDYDYNPEMWKCPYKPGEIRVMREPLKRFSILTLYTDDEDYVLDASEACVYWRWKRDTLSQIFMPTEYGRTLCRILDVKAERVQDISEEDCIAEGSQTPCDQLPKSCQQATMTERTQFSRIWNSISGPGAWERDDWVFKYVFEVI